MWGAPCLVADFRPGRRADPAVAVLPFAGVRTREVQAILVLPGGAAAAGGARAERLILTVRGVVGAGRKCGLRGLRSRLGGGRWGSGGRSHIVADFRPGRWADPAVAVLPFAG